MAIYDYDYLYLKPDMMNERSLSLKKIRPPISSAKITLVMTEEERFQNVTLRPILKLQNDLFLHIFQDYIIKRKNVFYQLSIEKRLKYITHSIQKDLKFQNILKGIIIGQLTIKEYDSYAKNSSALNKRIMAMLIKRLQDQIQYFEKEVLI